MAGCSETAGDDDTKYSQFINLLNVSAWRSQLLGFPT